MVSQIIYHFYSLCKSKAPDYLYSEIPQQRNLVYNLRNPHCYEQPTGRTIRYSNSYFQNTISEWNLLDNKVRNSSTISQFKENLLGIIRPSKNPTYNIRDILGIRLLTKLRVEFSALNGHRFKHNFACLSPMCVCGTGTEDNEHFLLHCPLYSILRQDLFTSSQISMDSMLPMLIRKNFVFYSYLVIKIWVQLQTESY